MYHDKWGDIYNGNEGSWHRWKSKTNLPIH